MQTNDQNYSSNHDYSSIPPSTTTQVASTPTASSTSVDASVATTYTDEITIPLLEEQLNVYRRRQKVGEVVIRREVETRIIEVPVRREKLIVEQVNPEFRRIASIDLAGGEEEIASLKGTERSSTEQTLKASYTSIEDASRALTTIAEALAAHCHSVHVTMFLQKGTVTEQTTHQFGLPATASQMLSAIAPSFVGQCQQIELEIVANAEALQRIYQHWVQQRTTQSSALAGARDFSVS